MNANPSFGAVPTGPGRYYDGLLYLLGLLHAGGRFRVHEPR